MAKGRKFKNWIIIAQPWAFHASASAAMIAISYIYYLYKGGVVEEVNWLFGLLAMFGAIIFQMSGNLMNEYHDFVKGVDVKEKTGPPRLIVQGIFRPKTVLIYGLVMEFVGIIIGIYLLLNSGWPLLILGLLGVLFATFYHKFKYIAMGDLIIFICWGLVIGLGVGFVMTKELIWQTLLITTPNGLLIVAILHANNTRDMHQDRAGGIRTQAMKLGVAGSQTAYQTLLILAYLLTVILVFVHWLHSLSLLVFFSFPYAMKSIGIMNKATEENLSPIDFLDERTSKLTLFFSILFAFANFIAPYI